VKRLKEEVKVKGKGKNLKRSVLFKDGAVQPWWLACALLPGPERSTAGPPQAGTTLIIT